MGIFLFSKNSLVLGGYNNLSMPESQFRPSQSLFLKEAPESFTLANEESKTLLPTETFTTDDMKCTIKQWYFDVLSNKILVVFYAYWFSGVQTCLPVDGICILLNLMHGFISSVSARVNLHKATSLQMSVKFTPTCLVSRQYKNRRVRGKITLQFN